MKTQDLSNKKAAGKNSTWLKLIVFVVLVAAVVTGVVWAVVNQLTYNFAQEAAQPLEDALLKNGAVKTCSTSSPGKGPDNYRPSYGADFQLNMGKDEAAAFVKKIAADRGFSLTSQATNIEGVSSFVDRTSKKSNYPGYTNGNIELGFTIYDSGNRLNCGSQGKPFVMDGNHVGLEMGVILPDGASR